MEYAYAGAHALVQLHERHLRAFVVAWKAAVADGVALPPSDDPTCASLGALLHHVLGAARGYMVWICRNLGLEDPGIRDVPADVEADLDGYVEQQPLTPSGRGVDRALLAGAARLRHAPGRWGREGWRGGTE